MTNLRFLTAKGLMIGAAISIGFTSAEPAFTQTIGGEWIGEIESVFQPRLDQLVKAREFALDSGNTMDQKLDEIAKTVFQNDEKFKVGGKVFSESSLSEEEKNSLSVELVVTFIKYVNGMGKFYYQFLSEKLRSSALDATGNPDGRFQRDLLEAFQNASSKSSTHLSWERLSEVSKNKAIYRLISDIWIPDLDKNIDGLNAEVKSFLKEEPGFLEDLMKMRRGLNLWGISSKRKEDSEAVDKLQLVPKMGISLYQADREILLRVKEGLETWFSRPENIRILSRDDLRKISSVDKEGKFDFDPKGQACPTMICESRFRIPEYTVDHKGEVQDSPRTIDVSRNPLLDNEYSIRHYAYVRDCCEHYFGEMVDSLEEVNDRFDEFHKDLMERLNQEIQKNEGKISYCSSEKLSSRAMRRCIAYTAPKAIEDLKHLGEKLSERTDVLDDEVNSSLENLRVEIQEFQDLLANHYKDDHHQVVELLKKVANTSHLCTLRNLLNSKNKPEVFQAYARAHYVHLYALSMMSLHESHNAYFNAGLTQRARIFCNQMTLVQTCCFGGLDNSIEGSMTWDAPRIEPKDKQPIHSPVNNKSRLSSAS